MREFRFSLLDKVSFYGSYFWYKLLIPLEVRHPKWKMWTYEWAYSLAKFKDYDHSLVWPHDEDQISTRFGTFGIRADTSDAAAVSPAFERRDVKYLLALLARLLAEDKQVRFLDIGGDLGTYSITVGNRFPDAAMGIEAFEPVPASCEILRRNADLNGLSNRVRVHELALMNRNDDEARMQLDAETPGSSSTKADGGGIAIRMRRLDDLEAFEITEETVLVVKIDVEGAEEDVLEGATEVLSRAAEVYLVIEDFIDTSIIDYLQRSGWVFLAKRTTYNSWWHRKRATA